LSSAHELEHVCTFRAECQASAAGFWGNLQLLLGSAAAITAGVAGASAFSHQSLLAGGLAVSSSALAATLTTLKPGERATAHQQSGSRFDKLMHAARHLQGVHAAHLDDSDLESRLNALIAECDNVTSGSPFVNRRLCRGAQRSLSAGRAYYATAWDGLKHR
jgi:hypothetical protein